MTKGKKNVREPKEKVVNVKMTEGQHETLDAVAASEGLGLSTWLLRLGLVAAAQHSQQQAQGRSVR